MPHSVRGSLDYFTQFAPTFPSYDHCSACSPDVINAYKQEGFNFVLNAGNDPEYVLKLSGLADMVQDIKLDEVMEMACGDSFSISSCDS